MPTCQGCRAKIEFIEGPKGSKIPVQRVRTVYELHSAKLYKANVVTARYSTPPPTAGVREIWISHFETCPDAGKF